MPVFIFSLLLSTANAALTGYTVEHREYAETSFDIATFDLSNVDLKLYWRGSENTSYGSLGAVRDEVIKEKHKFLFATNSGIYDKELEALGLHVEAGKTIRPVNKSRGPNGNFGMIPNGIFLMNKKGARVIETSEYSSITDPADYATQSGPLLVRKGELHPKFQKNSDNKKSRSGVGVDGKGRVVFAISKGGVSFYDFAMLFKTQLDCADALYLDGTISQFLLDDAEPEDQLAPFVGIWAAMEKRPPERETSSAKRKR